MGNHPLGAVPKKEENTCGFSAGVFLMETDKEVLP
jgi:hypothetical protein